jgi:hypothetical protein
LFILVAAPGLLPAGQTTSSSRPIDPDEGSVASVNPHIPEPMVFDLVRPLGAKRGELEVNSLFRLPTSDSSRQLLWAPEVEYTFADGMGIEFELPMENGRVDSFKAALQATLPPSHDRVIQGVQLLGEKARVGPASQLDILHLLGVRWKPRWSTFTMTGLRREQVETVRFTPVFNHSVFFEPSSELAIGLETNWKGKGASNNQFLLMPQVHWKRSRLNIQAGYGFSRRVGRTTGVLSWRIIREF